MKDKFFYRYDDHAPRSIFLDFLEKRFCDELKPGKYIITIETDDITEDEPNTEGVTQK